MAIDVILNMHEPLRIVALLENLKDRNTVAVMIHEQFFYKDYPYYQSNFREKLEKTFQYLTDNGFESAFYEDLL